VSAAERLKVIEVKFAGNDREWAEALKAMRVALPQIVAVVEAAEQVSAEYADVWPPEESWKDGAAQCYRALSALDEALEAK
jgi:hypothetical protein